MSLLKKDNAVYIPINVDSMSYLLTNISTPMLKAQRLLILFVHNFLKDLIALREGNE